MSAIPCVVLLLALAASMAGCASAAGGPPDPRTMVPPGVDRAHLHFSDPVARVGEPAPAFHLSTADGGTSLGPANFRGRPLVIVFGSRT